MTYKGTELQPITIFFDCLLIGHNGRWPEVLNLAAIRRLPAVPP